MEFNMEWTQICRICLQEGEMKSIFDNTTNIYEKLMQCSSIKIYRNVNLPKQICKNCIHDLEIAYKFHTNCESSDAILKSYIETTTNLISNDNKKCVDKFDEEDLITPSNLIDKTEEFVNTNNKNMEQLNTNFCSDNKNNNSIFIKSYKFCPPAGLKVRRINGKSSTELLGTNFLINNHSNVKYENSLNIYCNDKRDDNIDEDQNEYGNIDVKPQTSPSKSIVYDDEVGEEAEAEAGEEEEEEDIKDKSLLLISNDIGDDNSNFIDRDDYIEFLINGDLDKDIVIGNGSCGDDGDDICADNHVEHLQKPNKQELLLSNKKYILSIKNEINNEIEENNLKQLDLNDMEMIIGENNSNINLINQVIEDNCSNTTIMVDNNMILNDYEQMTTASIESGTNFDNEEIMHIKPVRCSKNLRYGKSQLDEHCSSGESKGGGGGDGAGGGESSGGGDVGSNNNIRSKENIQILTKDILYGENMPPVYRLKRCPTSQINQRHSKPLRACEICGNQYKHQHALESHMRRHRNEKPFKCEICGKAFVINFELNRHKRTHTGQKPYACKFCDRRFSDFGSRIKHERTHTGERPYKCTTCGKSFAYSHVLNSHNLTHTGEKKYHCEKCGKRFTKSHHLKAHMNTHDRNRTAATKLLIPAAAIGVSAAAAEDANDNNDGDDDNTKIIIRNQLNLMEIINENIIINDNDSGDQFIDETNLITGERFRKFSLQYSTTFDINDDTHINALMSLPD